MFVRREMRAFITATGRHCAALTAGSRNYVRPARLISPLMVPSQAGARGPRPESEVQFEAPPQRQNVWANSILYGQYGGEPQINLANGAMSAPLTRAKTRFNFTAAEDMLILNGVRAGGTLRSIQETDLPHRSISAIKKRWSAIDPRSARGDWTPEETSALLTFIAKCKTEIVWTMAARAVGTRSRHQCLQKWVWLRIKEVRDKLREPRKESDAKILKLPKTIGGTVPFTVNEILIFANGLRLYGHKWRMISKDLPGRDPSELFRIYWENKAVRDELVRVETRSQVESMIKAVGEHKVKPWTKEEDEKLKEAMNKLWSTIGSWNRIIEKFLPDRSLLEIRARWSLIDPNALRSPLSHSEKLLITEYVAKFGERFKDMGRLSAFKGRTVQQLQTWWAQTGKLQADRNQAFRLTSHARRNRIWPEKIDEEILKRMKLGEKISWVKLAEDVKSLSSPPKTGPELRKRVTTLSWRQMRDTNKEPITLEIIEEAKSLSDSGMRWSEIEKRLNYPVYSLWRYVKMLRTNGAVDLGSSPEARKIASANRKLDRSEEIREAELRFDNAPHGEYKNSRAGLSRWVCDHVMRWNSSRDAILYHLIEAAGAPPSRKNHGVSDAYWSGIADSLKWRTLKDHGLDRKKLNLEERKKLSRWMVRPLFIAERCERRWLALKKWEETTQKSVIPKAVEVEELTLLRELAESDIGKEEHFRSHKKVRVKKPRKKVNEPLVIDVAKPVEDDGAFASRDQDQNFISKSQRKEDSVPKRKRSTTRSRLTDVAMQTVLSSQVDKLIADVGSSVGVVELAAVKLGKVTKRIRK